MNIEVRFEIIAQYNGLITLALWIGDKIGLIVATTEEYLDELL